MALPDPPKWWPQVVNIPTTQTILALSMMGGLYCIMAAGVKVVDPELVRFFRDGMFLILGFYFAKEGERRGAERDAMLIAAGTGNPPSEEPPADPPGASKR